MIIRLMTLCCLAMTMLLAVESRGPQIIHLDSTSASVSIHFDVKIQVSILYTHNEDNILSINNAENKDHIFNLKDLKPDTGYTYTITGMGFKSEAQTFTTPPLYEDQIRFCAYGHSRRQNINEEVHASLIKRMLADQPQMIIHTGNLLGGGPRTNPSLFGRDWSQNFFTPLGTAMSSIPVYICPGQHDISFVNGIESLQQGFPYLKGHAVYVVERGPVAMVFLTIPQRISEWRMQADLIESALQEVSFAKWRFVCMHVPPLGVGLRGWVTEDREALLALFQKYRVDVIISGRQQNYQRLFPLRMSEDDQHAMTVISTSLGMDYLRDRNLMLLTGNDRDMHYVRFDCNAESLTLAAVNISGRILDQTVIKKDLYQNLIQKAKIYSSDH